MTRTGYDAAGRKVADTATDGHADAYTYDRAGHVILHQTRNSTQQVTWQYDALGELLGTTMVGGFDHPVSFDPGAGARKDPDRGSTH